MGYSYDMSNRLCCDGCGIAGGVRRRKCTETVTSSSLRGARMALPYCPPPALCTACFKKAGGTQGIHARCVAPAAAMQDEADVEEALIQAGAFFSVAAFGSWHATVPQGMTGLVFKGLCRMSGERKEINVLVPADRYDNTTIRFTDVSDVAVSWDKAAA